MRLGCRVAEGIAERVIFRSLFPTGLTVFDPLDEDLLGGLPSMSHLSARQEYRQLLDALRLPVSERARRPPCGAGGLVRGRRRTLPVRAHGQLIQPNPGSAGFSEAKDIGALVSVRI